MRDSLEQLRRGAARRQVEARRAGGHSCVRNVMIPYMYYRDDLGERWSE
jgi:hypothetical protein